MPGTDDDDGGGVILKFQGKEVVILPDDPLYEALRAKLTQPAPTKPGEPEGE